MTPDPDMQAALALSDDDLLAALDAAMLATEAEMRRFCIFAAVAEARELPTRLLPQVARMARDVAEGRLSIHAAWVLGGRDALLRHLLVLPLADQDRLADGGKVKIAIRNDQGRIVSAEKTIWDMTEAERVRAFGAQGIRDWTVQGELLIKGHNAAPPDAPPPRPQFKVNPATGKPRVTRGGDFDWDDLTPMLARFGLKLTPIYARPLPPSKVT